LTKDGIIVRSEIGQKLLDLVKKHGVVEFKDVPEENIEKLKNASANKTGLSQQPDNKHLFQEEKACLLLM